MAHPLKKCIWTFVCKILMHNWSTSKEVSCPKESQSMSSIACKKSFKMGDIYQTKNLTIETAAQLLLKQHINKQVALAIFDIEESYSLQCYF